MEINAQALSEHGTSAKEFIDLFREAGFEPFEIKNTYAVSEYWETKLELDLKPLCKADFVQADIVFKRSEIS